MFQTDTLPSPSVVRMGELLALLVDPDDIPAGRLCMRCATARRQGGDILIQDIFGPVLRITASEARGLAAADRVVIMGGDGLNGPGMRELELDWPDR